MPSPEEYDVARFYWSLPLDERRWQKVAERFKDSFDGPVVAGKVLENRLSRMARHWEEKGHVRHLVLREKIDQDYLPRMPDIEEQLRVYFPLRQALVVDTSSLLHESHPDDFETDVHKALGTWGARLLTSVMRPGDVVGCGGGRGPHYCVERCQFRHGLVNRVVSLTGQISANVRQMGVSQMDADQVASRLCGILAAEHLDRVGPIAPHGEKRKIDTSKVNLALIGIGSLTTANRLFYTQDWTLKDVEAPLRRLEERVAALGKGAGSGEGTQQSWIGDLCNFLFLTTTDANWESLKASEQKTLEHLVESVNKHLRCPPPRRF